MLIIGCITLSYSGMMISVHVATHVHSGLVTDGTMVPGRTRIVMAEIPRNWIPVLREIVSSEVQLDVEAAMQAPVDCFQHVGMETQVGRQGLRALPMHIFDCRLYITLP